jgi:hypothetical protein
MLDFFNYFKCFSDVYRIAEGYVPVPKTNTIGELGIDDLLSRSG